MAKNFIDYLGRDNLRAKFLDRMIPLADASHADVVEYGIDTPLRYTECYARLADGRIARFRDRRQFVAWSGRGQERSFLFNGRHGRIELLARLGEAPRVVRPTLAPRKFVQRDGSHLVVQRWGRVFAMDLGPRDRACADNELYPLPQLQ